MRCRRHKFDPWVRKISGGGSDDPLQHSCLENPMDRGACWATRVGHDWATAHAHRYTRWKADHMFSPFQTSLFHLILPPPILFHANLLYPIPLHSGSTNACLSPTCEHCWLLYLTPTSLLSFPSLSDSFWWPRAAPVFVFSLMSLPPSNSSSPGGALGKLHLTDRTLSLASDIPYGPRVLTWTPGCHASDNQRGWGQWQFFTSRSTVCPKDVSEQRA